MKSGSLQLIFIIFVLINLALIFPVLQNIKSSQKFLLSPFKIIGNKIHSNDEGNNYIQSETKSKRLLDCFWDSMKQLKDSNESSKCLIQFEDLLEENLWRHSELSGLEEDRWIAQKLWQMKAKSWSNLNGTLKFKRKLILLWVSHYWWGNKTWREMDPPEAMIPAKQCPEIPNSIGKCFFTQNRSLLQSPELDAIILDLDPKQIKSIPNLGENIYRIFYNWESPYHSPGSEGSYLNRSRDILATQWSGSQIVTPYYRWVAFKKTKNSSLLGRKDFQSMKSKDAAVVISNCNAKNNRIGYLKEIQKYIQVDVFGACGGLPCGNNCFETLKKDYFFYFAFENSNCRDYITEKFFRNALGNEMIPVVLGAHPMDYLSVAPPHSYIHIEDFKSPEELANYLKYLIKNKEEYNAYFKWKDYGRIFDFEWYCRVCDMLHYAEFVKLEPLEDPFVWTPEAKVRARNVTSRMCLKENEWYWSSRGHTGH